MYDKPVIVYTLEVFFINDIIDAHKETLEKGITNSVASCTMYIELGRKLYMSTGSEKNIKLTTVEDTEIFKALLNSNKEIWLHSNENHTVYAVSRNFRNHTNQCPGNTEYLPKKQRVQKRSYCYMADKHSITTIRELAETIAKSGNRKVLYEIPHPVSNSNTAEMQYAVLLPVA